MTVTDIRTRKPAELEPTHESAALAALDADIAALDAKLTDPQGWGDQLEAAKARLVARRAELLAKQVQLTATTVLAA